MGFLFLDSYNKELTMSDLYIQFISIAIIHIFAVMIPGPDFAIIVRQSIASGRKAALSTSLGIGTGILGHTTLCMLGLSMIIAESNFLFNQYCFFCFNLTMHYHINIINTRSK